MKDHPVVERKTTHPCSVSRRPSLEREDQLRRERRKLSPLFCTASSSSTVVPTYVIIFTHLANLSVFHNYHAPLNHNFLQTFPHQPRRLKSTPTLVVTWALQLLTKLLHVRSNVSPIFSSPRKSRNQCLSRGTNNAY